MTDTEIYELMNRRVIIKDDSYLKRTGNKKSYSTFIKIENKTVYYTCTHEEVYANKSKIFSINFDRKVTGIVEHNPNSKKIKDLK